MLSDSGLLSRRRVLGGLGMIGAATLVGGCTADQVGPDVHRPEDDAFFEAQNGTAAALQIMFSSIKEMTLASAAVVTAKITDVVPLHEVKAADDHFVTYGWVLEVSDTVRSGAGPIGTTTVELFGGAPDPGLVPTLRSLLPKAEQAIFLRSNAESWAAEERRLAKLGRKLPPEQQAWRDATGHLHTLVNSQGVVRQGQSRVARAFTDLDHGLDALTEELSLFRSVSELTDYVRKL